VRKITNFLYRLSIRYGFGRPTPIMMIGLVVLLLLPIPTLSLILIFSLTRRFLKKRYIYK